MNIDERIDAVIIIASAAETSAAAARLVLKGIAKLTMDVHNALPVDEAPNMLFDLANALDARADDMADVMIRSTPSMIPLGNEHSGLVQRVSEVESTTAHPSRRVLDESEAELVTAARDNAGYDEPTEAVVVGGAMTAAQASSELEVEAHNS